ncbi:AAA family ATPase [Anaerobacillus isosaccharinicus]|uniref:AAA family ATPase n=1 Tax=Anaerobacillus isosaccharinicus TaxID=1532552 RepID=A0A1S2MGG6_9BACI|nr:AAA family ATPase [Anaerobacillus isosaccharinicus]MBA5585008.1 AAA family ATPase [Anaerobacillus isosaccharinicus]QOY36639.1 AAA family ATPase [Anaerobacillus isosaccharinicus]
MHIKFVEVQNYRRLKSCRIEFTEQTTLFVGANNSGKTTAMNALVKFLDEKNQFSVNDFTLSNWFEINKIGESWLIDTRNVPDFSIDELANLIPTMDVWLHVEDDEVHYVTNLIPSLDWEGGLLGVRLRLEPKNVEELYKNFIDNSNFIKEILENAGLDKESEVTLWPKNLQDYLKRKFQAHFTVKSYILNPAKCVLPENGIARPQVLPSESEPIEGDPFKKLFLVHYINAQRGFSDPVNKADDEEESSNLVGNLSSQLRRYYNTHLNPTMSPDLTDIEALQAIEEAQKSFDVKLEQGFKNALSELETIGYPGFSNPKITISTKIKPIEGLNHSSAVQFDLLEKDSSNENLKLMLPEHYNGLGYQNIISIIFKLMRFRDEWMKVGKVSRKAPSSLDEFYVPPLHIVLVEEPEAHLHIQVQQVFIRQAYKVLRNHNNLKDDKTFKTQLIVSTHSGHITHEMPFSCLRYFRRKPSINKNEVPTSTVVNLSNVFGQGNKTERFVTRYLQSTHCDLFFADAAILVEGPSERMLVPHFIRNHFEELNQKYISLLEIGGSHAHTLRSLIEHLGLTSLIITDLDSVNPSNKNTAVVPKRKKGYITANDTLKSWVPEKTDLDELLDLEYEEKVKKNTNETYSVRVAYQYPKIISAFSNKLDLEVVPYTFEDALVYENLSLFESLKGNGLIKKFREAIKNKVTITELGEQFFEDLRKGKKAEFALELIYLEDPKKLKIPEYIKEGLTWLDEQLQPRQTEITIVQAPNLTSDVANEVKV